MLAVKDSSLWVISYLAASRCKSILYGRRGIMSRRSTGWSFMKSDLPPRHLWSRNSCLNLSDPLDKLKVSPSLSMADMSAKMAYEVESLNILGILSNVISISLKLSSIIKNGSIQRALIFESEQHKRIISCAMVDVVSSKIRVQTQCQVQ